MSDIDWFEQTIGPDPSDRTRRLGQSVTDDPSKSAGYGRQIAASLPTDERQKIEYFASKRFPNMDPKDAMSRYGYRDGRAFYTDDDGKAFFEESSPKLPGSLADINSTGKWLAGNAGPLMAPVAGTAGGIVTMPVAGGVPGAVIGGTAGETLRQGLAQKITGEEKSLTDRAIQSGGAGVSEGVGQGFGIVGGRVLNRVGRTPTYDINPSLELRQQADALGIPLTAAESTGNRALIRRQKVLQNTTGADETLEGFYKVRNEKVRDALYSWLGRTAPGNEGARGFAGAGVEGAQGAVAASRNVLQAQARPFYEDALQAGNRIDLMSMPGSSTNPQSRNIVLAMRKKMLGDDVYGASLKDTPLDSMETLDQTAKYLGDEIGAAKRAGNNDRARRLTIAKNDLQSTMDSAFPSYKKARAIYEDGMPGVNAVEKGVTGRIAKLKESNTMSAPSMLFGKNSSPYDIRVAKEAFFAAGKQDEWYSLVRSHMQTVLEDIPDSAVGAVANVGGTFRKAIFGSKRKMAMMKEALGDNPDALQSMTWMSNVLDATSRAMKGESITAFAQEGQRELAREGMGLGPRLLETVEIWKTPSRIASFWADVNAGKYANKMATLLTSPDGLQRLSELKGLSRGSKGAIIGLSHLLLTGAEGVVSGNPADSEPEVVERGNWLQTLGLE